MGIDISEVKRKLFGVSYLSDEVNKQVVEELWNSRFAPKNSFLLSAVEDDTVQTIVDGFQNMLQSQKIHSLAGERCILTFFVDCTQPFSQNMFSILGKLAAAMEMLWNCSVDAEVQFCYVGKLGLGSREAQRNNLRVAVENNAAKTGVGYHRLCVVATPSMGAASANNWKSVMAYVDLLRRSEGLTNLFKNPGTGAANSCVGYLHYEEFDQQVHESLVAKKNELSRKLGKNGEDELRDMLKKKREDIIQDVKGRFVVEAECQPIHPDMIVPEGGWPVKHRTKAKQGKYAPYNAAQAATRNAVLETGFRLRKEIDVYMQQHMGDAAEVLTQSIEKAGVGLVVKRDRVVMESALKLPGLATGEEPQLELAYREEGCGQEVKAYLEYIKQSAISGGIRKFSSALLEAYGKYTAEQMDAEEAQLREELALVEDELSEHPSVEEMCTEIAHSRDPRYTQFIIDHSVKAESAKLLLTRGSEMDQQVSEYIRGGSFAGAYFIKHPHGGIVKPDNAPVKALRIVYVQCNEIALQKLLPEVNV